MQNLDQISVKINNHEQDLGPQWLWKIRKYVKNSGYNFVLVESPHHLQRLVLWIIGAPGKAFYLPHFVERIVKNDSSVAPSRISALKSDIRRQKKPVLNSGSPTTQRTSENFLTTIIYLT